MDENSKRRQAPPESIEALEASEAEIGAGRTVPLEPVLARMQASLDRMLTRRAAQAKRPARGGRRASALTPSGNSIN